MARCEECHGTGKVWRVNEAFGQHNAHRWPCPQCLGTGAQSCCEGSIGGVLEAPPDAHADDQGDRERLLSKLLKGDCWTFTGYIDKYGYGGFWMNRYRRTIRAHRAAYLLFKGELPDNQPIDHLCKNRACCNPDHLELVSWEESGRRHVSCNASKTHCSAGHEYNEKNTLYLKRGGRFCRACNRIRMRKRQAGGPNEAPSDPNKRRPARS